MAWAIGYLEDELLGFCNYAGWYSKRVLQKLMDHEDIKATMKYVDD